MTEGEEFIAEYLESEGIDFREEELIEGLKNDTKEFRKADFYLPKYKVYIEYFGQWNSEPQKPRYREKRQVYKDNKIPCIILYPDNLGIISYIFPRRLDYVFHRYKMDKELRQFYFDEVKKERGGNLIFAIIGLVIIYFARPWDAPLDNTWLIIGFLLFAYQTYLISKSILAVYKGRNPVEKSYFQDNTE